jgi:eukaryotic-like serine/threonine-protein kinase
VKVYATTDVAAGDIAASIVAFRREAAVLACLHHAGLPEIFEVGDVAGRPYLVMELVEGQTLSEVIAGGSLGSQELAAVGIDVATALAVAHRHGLVHRDIKPDNVLMTRDGRAKVIDFGLAVRSGGDDSDAVVGTLLYSPPEQTGMLNRPVDNRSDLYALGAVLYECATGSPPFDVGEVGELIRLHASAVPVSLGEVRPDLDEVVVGAVARLLAKDPDDRYGSGDDLAADLVGVFGDGAPHAFGAARPDLLLLSGGGSDLALVGRDRELEGLEESWRQAEKGRGSVVVVEGDIGSGKTRLVGELGMRVGRSGRPVLVASCTPGLTPLGPLRQAVGDHVRRVAGLRGGARRAEVERLRSIGAKSAAVLAVAVPGYAEVCGIAIDTDAADDVGEYLGTAFADVVAAIAGDGAVLCVEDLQWLDDATRRVLVQLAMEIDQSRLLLVATSRRTAGTDDALEQLCAEIGAALSSRLVLPPLDDDAVGRLLTDRLGGADIDATFVGRLAGRCAGNPLAAVEQLRAILEAGLIRPSWGTCIVADDALDSLDLSGDVVDIVLRRADALDPVARHALQVAAVTGNRIDGAQLRALIDLEPDAVAQILSTASGLRLVEPVADGEYVFVHDCLPHALVEEVDPGTRRALHQRVAELLDGDDPDEATVFALARHYALGTGADPAGTARANERAGRTAFASKSLVEARAFFDAAAAAAAAAGSAPDVDLLRTRAQVSFEAGQLQHARALLGDAIELATDSVERAEIRAEMGAVEYADYDATSALEQTTLARAELGISMPANKLVLVVTTLAYFVAGIVAAKVPALSGTITGKARRRRTCEVVTASSEALIHYDGGSPAKMVVSILRSFYAANRLGPSDQYVYMYNALGLVASVLGRRERAARLHAKAAAAGESLGDPRITGRSQVMEAVGTDIEGDVVGAEQRFVRTLNDYGRWLSAEMYILACYVVGAGLSTRGYTRRAAEWFERALTRLQQAGNPQMEYHGAVWGLIGAQAMLGRTVEARSKLDTLLEGLEGHKDRERVEAILRSAEVEVLIAEGRVGAELDASVAGIDALGMNPKRTAHHMRGLWVRKARARTAQAFAAEGEERAARLEQLTAALGQLEQATQVAIHRSSFLVFDAGRLFLEGRHDEALARCAEAEQASYAIDAPMMSFEVAAARARSLRAMGLTAESSRLVRVARALAEEQGWLPRRARLDAEFGAPARAVSRGTRVSVSATATSSGGGASRHRRHLDALLQVSVAAATVFDPQELARVALDETLGILGAERALLFLCPSPDAPLVLQVARDGRGGDLVDVSDYSTSTVERVRSSREALVLTGSEDGAALGSMSVVLHGLRSVLVAPVQLEGRLLGVVYLDSRLARGIFTDDDVDILVAITNQVAVSLETARSAQLEVSVEAERRQRALAEMLRDSMAEASATLDPDEVACRVLGSLTQAVPAGAGLVVLADADAWKVAGVHGDVGGGLGMGSRLPRVRQDMLGGTLQAGVPVVVEDVSVGGAVPFAEVLGGCGSWIGVELAIRGKTVGVVVLTAEAGVLTSAHADIVAAFAGQGVVAYENARLFSEVQKLAVRDELTGLDNRRQLFERGEAALAKAREHSAPLAAVMLDIDHFKAVNDTHGHGVGDDVIRTIAARLRGQVRDEDALGRYGGEEFAVVVHGSMEAAMGLGERLRAAVAAEVVATSGPDLAVTVSVGVAAVTAEDAGLTDVLNRADAALYEAKRAGRNRVMAA